MAARSPEGQHDAAAETEHLEAPSAKAELSIYTFLADDDPEWLEKADGPAGPLPALLRRVGVNVGARMAVPPANASEMLATVRRMWLTVTWAVTVLATIAVTVPAGVPIAFVVTILAIELVGFAMCALSSRRRRIR
jgi:hypothetical protein